MMRFLCFIMSLILIGGCGGDDKQPLSENQKVTISEVVDTTPIFIKNILLNVSDVKNISSVSFSVAPKQNATADKVGATFRMSYLQAQGYVNSDAKNITVPVYGLYAGYANHVDISVGYVDGSNNVLSETITTPAFVDKHSVYDQVSRLIQPAVDKKPSYSFFYMKSNYSYPVIMDTDGEIRWQMDNGVNAVSSQYDNGGFVIGSASAPANLIKVFLDGHVVSTGQVPSTEASYFHHDLSKGKVGYFAEVNANSGGTDILESTLLEINQAGAVIKKWDLADIFNQVISAGGEDPSNFVRNGIDWFHMNSAIYDPVDDSVIISSRENFVIKLDYESGEIKWILGDQTKHWYQDYPSLRKYAITLTSGRYPIGQHALSLLSDGRLMLFNNGRESFNNPTGTSAGETRNYSPVSVYTLDEANLTATESFSLDNNQTVFSDICSSVYQDKRGDFLVSYATAENRTIAKLVGFDGTGNILFDYEMPTLWCNTSWNANIVDLSNIVFE